MFYTILINNYCNLSCKFCSHFSLLSKPKYSIIPVETLIPKILNILDNIEILYLLEREPLLNTNLENICSEIRKYYNGFITIVTNESSLNESYYHFLSKYKIILEISNYKILNLKKLRKI